MNVSKVILASSFAALFMSSAVQAVDSGTIDFFGELTNSPCTIKGIDLNKQVKLANVPAGDVTQSSTAATPFDITLENCVLSSQNAVTMTISGPADATNVEAFSMSGPGSNNLGLVLTAGGNPVKPNNSFDLPLRNGTNKLNFTAAYVKIADDIDLTEGEVNLSTTYTMTYN